MNSNNCDADHLSFVWIAAKINRSQITTFICIDAQ